MGFSFKTQPRIFVNCGKILKVICIMAEKLKFLYLNSLCINPLSNTGINT